MPARVDAIVVPGGSGDRIGAAVNLAEQNRARYLVLSEGAYIPPRLCGSRAESARVLCFNPIPGTTQGEAGETARLAKQYGFRSIVVVTTPDQNVADGTSLPAVLQRQDLRHRRAAADAYVATHDRLAKSRE
jgi:hypothetical protein